MKKYIIDGNNLIGKIPSLTRIQKKDKQAARARSAFLVDRFFSSRNAEVFLHFDGFASEKIKTEKVKLVYSESATADEKIKKQIEKEKNKRNLVVISSDNNIREFAKICSCEIQKSEEFAASILKAQEVSDEKERISQMDDNETFKRLFGV